ncbi:flippase, partial [Lactobacillus amylovorus]|nr:flippase [Lactobacillus amylovorus]
IGIVVVCLLCAWSWEALVLRMVFSVIFSVIVYGAILVLLRNEIAMSYIAKIKEIIKSKK